MAGPPQDPAPTPDEPEAEPQADAEPAEGEPGVPPPPDDSSVWQILPPIEGPLELHARPQFRLACFGGFLLMAALVALLWLYALPQVAQLDVQGYGGDDKPVLEQARNAMHLLVWAVMGFSALIGIWCLCCSRPGSRRLELELDGEELRFRPFLGRRRRIPVPQIRQIDERPGRLLRPAHLLLRWRKRRKLKLNRWWYGAEGFELLRTQLGRAAMASSEHERKPRQ